MTPAIEKGGRYADRLAHLAEEHGVVLHPNDHVNRSQSSNDTFPSALHIAAVLAVVQDVLPAAHRLEASFAALEAKYPDLIRIGRTHLQDAKMCIRDR